MTPSMVSNSAYFGGDGDDIFYSGYYGVNQIAIGGDGNDTYSISSPGFLTIADQSSSSFDVLETTGVGVYELNTFFTTVDGGRHLFVIDADSHNRQLLLWITGILQTKLSLSVHQTLL